MQGHGRADTAENQEGRWCQQNCASDSNPTSSDWQGDLLPCRNLQLDFCMTHVQTNDHTHQLVYLVVAVFPLHLVGLPNLLVGLMLTGTLYQDLVH